VIPSFRDLERLLGARARLHQEPKLDRTGQFPLGATPFAPGIETRPPGASCGSARGPSSEGTVVFLQISSDLGPPPIQELASQGGQLRALGAGHPAYGSSGHLFAAVVACGTQEG
jgi:hypothetical protein